ncbi:spindle and kinetochore-associated protein 1 [Megalops cyprinoides]|uniref:spindle and kinetochore-associated protein 1 n=1 Tax=Megalops cyprinoides TaxID=118141 RepID=UPI0018652CCA|nr:spindle and kinetochore-associated protein 1 [Megalops cyprinoides]XP_036385782.1 spindle and kinetochore-associated protein 1 [Megalops cyprinoides]
MMMMMMMNSCDVGELALQINDKISAIRRILELRPIAQDQEKRNILLKLGQNVLTINGLIDKFKTCICQQKDMLKSLKELEEFFLEDLKDGRHLRENLPPHMPRKGLLTPVGLDLTQSCETDVQPAKQQILPRKLPCKQIRGMEYITIQEFEGIPQYMKGRMTHSQLNAAVQSINTAVMEKYSVLQQPSKTLSNTTRKLHQRFKDEETKDTKGRFFVVEADIREFTQMKVDKGFQSMLSMLRHCQRLREARGGGLVRYVLL